MKQPDQYVDIQYHVNNRHTDGSVEAPYEEAVGHVALLAKWIKWSKLPAESFLDVGCRTGYGMDALATHFPAAEIQGCDIVPQFVEAANLRGEVRVEDMHQLTYADQQFDWTFCCTTIEHCYDAKRATNELKRVSRVGMFIITDLEDEARFNANPSHFAHHNDPAEWVDEFRGEGWWLMSLAVPRYSRVEMLWVRREHVAQFKKDEDTWPATK